MSVRSAFPLLLVAALAAPLAAQETTPPPTPTPLSAADSVHLMQLGHTYVQWLLHGRSDSLIGAMTTDFLNASGGPVGVAEHLAVLSERGGEESQQVAEKMTRRNGRPQFWHEGNFTLFTDEPLVIRFLFDSAGKIDGIGLTPKSRAPSDQ